jgi:hypothetical protein
MRTKEQEVIASLRWREAKCWDMAEVFLQNRDAHGVMDMGAELQSLQRAINELERLQNA